MSKPLTPVPPKSLTSTLEFVANGGRLVIPTYARVTVISQRDVDKWAKAGRPLLREDGNGYRLACGRKSSVFLLPGQLAYLD